MRDSAARNFFGLGRR